MSIKLLHWLICYMFANKVKEPINSTFVCANKECNP